MGELLETIFLITINIHRLRKVRFPLPEAVFFIDYCANWAGIVQKQDFVNNFKTNCHRHINMVSLR